MQLKTGITLQGGKYLLNQALGDQDFGITYLATQTYLNQTVVIKTIDPSLQVTRGFPHLHQRFVEETRLLARSQHPSIVRVLDFFQEENLPFVVMDHVPGKTLDEVIKAKGALPQAQAIHYIRQIGSALAIAHHNGLIHRNLKPQTVILRQGTHLAILVGFSIAHDLSSSVTPPPYNLHNFAPPDASWMADNRFAIDLYALAAIFYYLLTARLPSLPLQFDGQIWNPAVKQAILRGLSSDKNARPQTIADWLRLLPRESLPMVAPPTKIVSPSPTPAPQNGNGHSVNAASVPIAQAAIPPVEKKPSTDNGHGAALPIVPPETQPPPTVKPPIVAGAQKPTSFPARLKLDRLPKILGLTSAAAAVVGVGFGLVLRFSAAQAPGASIFHPEQSFPAKDWKGTPTANDLSETPSEKPATGAASRNTVDRPSENSIPSGSDYRNAPPADTYLEPAPARPVTPRPVTPRTKPPTDEAPAPVVKPDPAPVPPASVAPASPDPVVPAPPAPEPPAAAPEPPPSKQPIEGSTRDVAPLPPKE
ncbi:protein kinase domain-containing protein [Phormidesmis priestleyi]